MLRAVAGQARIIGLALGLAALAPAAEGQHGGGPGHSAHGADGHRVAQQCIEEFERVVADGRGFGLAFGADQHGYPGPLHILELKERLGLTPEQERRARALLDAMFAESRPTSARLLEAERRLADVFRAGTADEAAVRAAVADVERARTEVRLAHLLTHLKGRDLLTEAQRVLYHETRWGR
jgi:Spy/CpxP family protein refolding chaperone